MSRVEMKLEGESEHEVSLDLKPLPWPQCALLIFLVSALCYGVGYAAIDLLIYGRL